MMNLENPNAEIIKIFKKISIRISIFSLILMIIPGLFPFGAIIGVFSSGIYFATAILLFSGKKLMPKMEGIQNGDKRIAYWVLSQSELQEYSADEYKRQKSNYKITAAVFLIIGIFAAIIYGDFTFLAVAIGLMLFSYLFGKLFAEGWRTKNVKGNGEVIIAETGLIINGYFHTWDMWGRGLIEVKLDNEEKNLIFRYNSTYKGRESIREAYVPIPGGHIESAKRVVEHFKNLYEIEQKN